MTVEVSAPLRSPAFMSLVLGLASLLFSFAFVGVVMGVIAVVFGVRARKAEPDAPRWVPVVGIVSGIAGIVASVLWGAFILFVAVLVPLWAISASLPEGLLP